MASSGVKTTAGVVNHERVGNKSLRPPSDPLATLSEADWAKVFHIHIFLVMDGPQWARTWMRDSQRLR